MSYSPALQDALDKDIETMFPPSTPTSTDTKARVLMLPGTKAPILMITRDSGLGSRPIVPHFFFTSETPAGLMPYAQLIQAASPEIFILFHLLEGINTEGIMVCPFLFDRRKTSLDFVKGAFEMGKGMIVRGKINSAFRVIDLHLRIVANEEVHSPASFPDKFNHLLIGNYPAWGFHPHHWDTVRDVTVNF